MRNLSSEGFLRALVLVFFGAVGLDFARIMLGIDRGAGQLIIYLISAILLSLLLYFRLDQNHQNRAWAILGFIPPLGIAFGLYLYLRMPGSGEGRMEDN